MAETSQMVPLGTPAPELSLLDLDGHGVSLADVADYPALLVAFLCNHCPYVRHVEDGFAALADDYTARGVAVVGVCSNDASAYPDDGPEGLAAQAQRAGFAFPYLLDTDQRVARDYGAVCTPDFFVFDGDQRLAYRGRMDGSRPKSDEPVTGADLRAALDAVLSGEPVPEPQFASMGCGIKWKPA